MIQWIILLLLIAQSRHLILGSRNGWKEKKMLNYFVASYGFIIVFNEAEIYEFLFDKWSLKEYLMSYFLKLSPYKLTQ
jgi:hypothetical protein